MAIDTIPRSRRAILIGAFSAVAATVGSALGRPEVVRAGTDGDVVLGAVNVSGTKTQIEVSGATGAALVTLSNDIASVGLRGIAPGVAVTGESPGAGVLGKTTFGTGVRGEATAGGIGLWGQTNGAGLPGVVARGLSKGIQVIVGPDTGFPVHPANVGVYAQTIVDPNVGFIGVHAVSNQGIGVKGTSIDAEGVVGESFDTGVRGISSDTSSTGNFDLPSHNTGVLGAAGGAAGIPINTDETGVYGFCDLSPVSTGVWGDSGQGYGVFGSGDVGVGGSGYLGLFGYPSGAGATGVFARAGTGQTAIYGFAGIGQPPAPTPDVAVHARAESTSQIALNVVGKAKFSRSGRTSLATGTSTKTITMAGVTTSSYVIATLQTSRSGIYVRAVVPAAGSFKIYLNTTVPGTTYVGYLVIN